MTTEINKVIGLLDQLMVDLQNINYPGENDSWYLHDIPSQHEEIKKKIEEIEGAASGVFIISSGRLTGQPDFERHRLLKTLSNGKYHITKGESDSFGWLSGKLNTPRGIIVYG